ncbi:hypothetical protein DPMN_052488 [Dreissena polymorpha]|uniref:Uncharacterized protein n=1 Tax=Dreissena polymorpha TaxID=45954 RepID=A0A9D4CM20_DREPO|nr:hypothetical protein DPMN_052488 [Dreissena polymorpha]
MCTRGSALVYSPVEIDQWARPCQPECVIYRWCFGQGKRSSEWKQLRKGFVCLNIADVNNVRKTHNVGSN